MRRAALFTLCMCLVGSPVSASPPGVPPSEAGETGEVPQAPPPLIEAPGGFWLSVELLGPRGAQLDAVRSLARPPVIDALPRGGAPPPGELVGRVDTLAQALEWIDANSFAPLAGDGERNDALLVPGGQLYREHGLFLTALVINAQTLGGAEPYPWPPADALMLPESLDWQPASLAVGRAPVFATPAPSLPPAAERYQVATIEDSIWLLGERDSCAAEGRSCLAWARILIRHGDRFFGGWVPATWVVPDSAWVGGPGERRFALRRGHRTRKEAGFALIEQQGERREAPVGLSRDHVGDGWPSAGVTVLGEELLVTIAGEPKLSRHISTEALAPL
jgi:hypothetical protein